MKLAVGNKGNRSPRIWVRVFVFFGYLLGAFVMYGSGLLAPLNVPIAIYLVYRAVRVGRTLVQIPWVERRVAALARRTKRTIVLHRVGVSIGVLLLMLWYMYTSLLPNDQDVFTHLGEAERATLVADDVTVAANVLDMLMTSGDTLLANRALHKTELTLDEHTQLVEDWNAFLNAAILSEGVTDTHRYFHQISRFDEREVHAQSFVIAYALYMKKFEYFLKIIAVVGTNATVRTILNEYSPAFGSVDSYQDIADRFFASNSFLRRTVGYLYYLSVVPDEASVASGEYAALIRVGKESEQYLFTNSAAHITHRSLFYTQQLDEALDDAWLPVQKTVFVDTVGNIHVGARKEKFITEADIVGMKPHLQPGDIFVARKNWYASNLGIPGFWTHAGLYTGTLEEMQAYFGELFPYTYRGVAYETLGDLLRAVSTSTYEGYSVPDADGHNGSVIESETKGVNVHSLEYTAHVDYFAVMRPERLSKRDVLEAILRASVHTGKTYDYSFDMYTKDEIYCSELVYDAYLGGTGKVGITFPTSVVTGKEIVAPVDIVKKFVDELPSGQGDLSFVYFLDGREETEQAVVGTESDFIESFSRPKYSAGLD